MKKKSKYRPKAPRIRMWSWESDRSTDARFVTCQAKHQFGWVNLDGHNAFKAVNKPQNWTLIVRAILWYPDGNVDVVPAIIHQRGATLKTLENEARALRKEILRTAKREHIVDVGWFSVTFNDKPEHNLDTDMIDLGAITEERQMLWNLAWREEVEQLLEEQAA
jgi:hypothetical protein